MKEVLKSVEIAKKLGLSPQHFGKIYKKMNKYAEFDFNFWENRKKDRGYMGWFVEEDGSIVYGNWCLVGNLMRTIEGRLFFSGDEKRNENQGYLDSSIIFNK